MTYSQFDYMTTDDIEADISQNRDTWHNAKARNALDELKLHECADITRRIAAKVSWNKSTKDEIISQLPDIVHKLNEYLEVAHPDAEQQTARVKFAISKVKKCLFVMQNYKDYTYRPDNSTPIESCKGYAKGKHMAQLFIPEFLMAIYMAV